ncbi:MAG: hypothetical protein PHN75_15190, partial [Syntrophales bacterium]|nr:hypothetical protein [Syntrophales bacterium]
MRQISLAQEAVRSGIAPVVISHSPLVIRLCEVNKIPFFLIKSRNDIPKIIKRTRTNRLIIDVQEPDFSIYHPLCNNHRCILMVSEIGFNFPPFGDHIIRIGRNLHEWDCQEEITHMGRNTRIHSGRAWMIFRDEYNLPANRIERDSKSILICHGGTDPFKLTQRCLGALEFTQKSYNCTVLVTEFFSDLDQIYALSNDSQHNCEVIIRSERPGFWMMRSGVGLINGGNVRYELCVTQTPFVAVSFQPQQFRCTKQVTDLGAGINLGIATDVTDIDIACAVENLIEDRDRWQAMHDAMGKLF